MIPYVECALCRDREKPTGIKGFYLIKEEFGTVLKECECHKKWVKENMMLIEVKKANIWTTEKALQYNPVRDHIGTNDVGTISALSEYFEINADIFCKEGECFFITGGFATQKTTIIQWIGLQIFKSGYTAYYENMHNFIVNLVPVGFNDLEKHKAYYDRIQAVDVLILDNIFEKARVNMQSFHIPYIEAALRDRIDQNKRSVIFVSSNDLSNIKDENARSLSEFVKKVSFANKIILTDSTTAVKIDGIFNG